MPTFRGEDLAPWSGGAWRGTAPGALEGVSADTRDLPAGSLYVALRGDRHDGHDFVDEAFRRGAAAAMVSLDFAAAQPTPPGPLLAVRDTLEALGRMAQGYRRSLGSRFVGVTGSVGKTTVKEMVADVLGLKGLTARTRGNWNNHIGLPLSLLAMERTDVFGVFELGMNHPGELQPLCDQLRPQWGIVTNVGPVHLGFFDSVRAIAEEKAVLVRSLPGDGVALLSRDHAWFELLSGQAPCRVVSTSLGGAADYEARPAGAGLFNVLERASGEHALFEMPLPGDHVIRNALFAIAAGRLLGVPWDALRRVMAAYRPQPMRWAHVSIGRVDVINDAYNSNPLSAAAALDAFAGTPAAGRRWLVLGGMLELGASEQMEHLRLGNLVAAREWGGLVAVGRLGGLIADGAEAEGFPSDRIFRCPGTEAAAAVLKERVRPGDVVLLKASRAEKLEKTLEYWSDGVLE